MPPKLLAVFAVALLLFAAGCRRNEPARTPSTPEAGYIVLSAAPAHIEIELPGRTTAVETSEVRPQVSGVLLARRFTEGSIVRQGQTLYEIDPSLYRAAMAQAQANLANAEASRAAAQARADRYKPLAAIEAVSQQDYTDALAQARQSAAQVQQAHAALQTSRINLGFTRVPAPITGRVGRSIVTTGALVTSGQANALTTITRLDPMLVDIQQSSADLLALRRRFASGGAQTSGTAVQLLLEDGSVYPLQGRVEFAEPIVDPATGAVTLRARFPNPQGVLLPGMYVRARFVQGVVPDAILVPQQAVTRSPRGEATVLVVGPEDRATLRKIAAERTIGDKWLVTQGLAAGDKVITEGLGKVKPGQRVRPVPAGAPPSRPGARPA